MAEQMPDESLLMHYIDGKMDAQDRATFEQRLATEPALQEELAQMQTAIAAVRYMAIVEKVRNINSELQIEQVSEGRVVSIRKAVRYSLAIAASLLLIVVGFQAYKISQLSPDGLYEETYVAYQLPELRSNESVTSGIEYEYRHAHFEEVVRTYKKATSLSPKEYLLTGISFLELNDPFQAIAPLKKAVSSESSYRQDGEYYLALAYLKNHDYDHALALMEKIHADPNHVYHQQFPLPFMRKVRMLKWR